MTPTRTDRFKAYFGLTKTPKDIGDDGHAFIEFVDSVLTAQSDPLLEVYNTLMLQVDTTGLTGTQIIGRLVDLLIVQHWGEEGAVAQMATLSPSLPAGTVVLVEGIPYRLMTSTLVEPLTESVEVSALH